MLVSDVQLFSRISDLCFSGMKEVLLTDTCCLAGAGALCFRLHVHVLTLPHICRVICFPRSGPAKSPVCEAAGNAGGQKLP